MLSDRTLGRPCPFSSDMVRPGRSFLSAQRAVAHQEILEKQPRVERVLGERSRLGQETQIRSEVRSSATTRNVRDNVFIFWMIPYRRPDPGRQQIVAPTLQPCDDLRGRS